MSFTVWARQDRVEARNPDLNPIGITGTSGSPAIQLTFVPSSPSGDAIIDYNGLLPDPDTLVRIGTDSYSFKVLLSGDLPERPNVPGSLVGRTIYLIEVTINNRVVEYFFETGQPPVSEAVMNQIRTGAIPLDNLDLSPPPYCLLRGTLIATPTGPRPVESLRLGDLVLSEDGRSVALRWIGVSVYSQWQASRYDAVRPVLIAAGSLGEGLPVRDLWLSPQHRVVVADGACELLFGHSRVLVAAKHLLGSVASSPLPRGEVAYYHLMLDDHEILLAEGLPVESFQPARRMVETLTGASRAELEAVLDRLGREHLLTRPDALPALAGLEARLLLRTAGLGRGAARARPDRAA